MAIRERSKAPISAMTMSLPRAGPTNRRGGEDGESSDRLDYKTKIEKTCMRKIVLEEIFEI